jgi:hypothetical protein
MKRLAQWLENVCTTIYHNLGTIFLTGAIIALLGSFGYCIYTYQSDSNELDKAYTAMDNGNYIWAMEQFQYVLDKQEERGYLFKSDKIAQKATAGLNSATIIYHYNSALEYYADEQWMDAIYHLSQVIDYRDSLALFQKCLDGYAMTYYNDHAPG